MPENWKTYQFANAPLTILDGDRGKNYPKSSEFKTHGHCLFLSAKNVTKTGFQFSEKSFISKERDHLLRKGKLERNDLVLTTRGTVGNVAYYGENVPFEHVRINSGMVILRTNKEALEDKFLYFFLRSPQFENQVLSNQTGSAQPQLPIRDLKTLKIKLPPLSEQKSIASILSALDDKIELNLQISKTLEEMAMALYKHWFADFGPFQDGEFVNSELGEIPKGWEISNFDQLLILQRGFDLPQKKRIEGGYSVFAASGRSTSHIEKKVNGPGVVTGRSGVLGKVFFVHEDFWPLNTTLWVKQYPNSSPYHAYFLLNSMDLKEFNSGSAVPTLNRNDVHRQRLVKPPLDVINRFDREINYYFDLQQLNFQENQTLTQLRDTLLPKLISGEVRVKDVEKTLSEIL